MKEAIFRIKNGDLVAFPTETVYGLGADASNEEAVRKIYAAKGRPSNNPLIVHASNIDDARKIAHFNKNAEVLASHFWPGPITFVLEAKRNNGIAQSVMAGLDTIAIRIPSHKLALDLLKGSSRFIAAPSANPSGYVSATLSSHIKLNLPDIYILEDESDNTSGMCNYGLESTIVDLSNEDKVTILRYGFITPEILSKTLGTSVLYCDDIAIKAPGMLAKHYSPRAKIRINVTDLEEGEIGIGFGQVSFKNNINQSSLMDLNLSKTGNLEEAARNLYSMLQLLDLHKDVARIAIAPIPNIGIGLAINDRLRRASY